GAGDDLVARVRRARRDQLAAIIVELPHPRRVGDEGLLAGVAAVVVVLPDPPRAAVRRHPALRRHARAREEDDAFEVAQREVSHVRILLTRQRPREPVEVTLDADAARQAALTSRGRLDLA